jgi:leucyl-tRNA synthetase
MGKSLKNAVAPDDIYRDYGADTLRLYEMFMGPIEASRPWNTADIVGVHRFLQRLWRNVVDEETGEARVSDDAADEQTRVLLHRTIAAVRDDYEAMSFNTAVARLFELNNHLTQVVQQKGSAPREAITPLLLMVAPLAPHIAEELWERTGHRETLAYESFPEPDAALLVADAVEVPVQVKGKVRARIMVPVGADDATHEQLARADEKIAAQLDGVTVKTVVVVPGRLVNFVV